MKFIFICLSMFLCVNVFAHQSSTSFVNFEQGNNNINGVWKIAIEDLTDIRNFDANNDGGIQWQELKNNKNLLLLSLKGGLKLISDNGMCDIEHSNSRLSLENTLDRNYILFPFKANCSMSSITIIKYNYFFDVDSDHKGIITISENENKPSIYVASVNNRVFNINSNQADSFVGIVKEGVWHIWMGFDHIIFVLTLLFGLLFTSDSSKPDKKSKIIEVTKVITAFTVAHSITLALAALDIMSPSIRLIESAIALTLVIAAIHNVRHHFPTKTISLFSWPIWKMAFVFGLIHGFGFANVLAEMNLSMTDIAKTLLAFNLGVEIGQLAIVVLFILTSLILFSFIKRSSLKKLIPISSILVMFVGTFWFVERAFEVTIF